jgi:hypothetical protein
MKPIQILTIILTLTALYIKGGKLLKEIRNKNKGGIVAESVLFVLILGIGVFLIFFLTP